MAGESDHRLRPIGNPQQVLVALFKALEQSEGMGSVRRAVKAARALGYEIRNSSATEWLAPFRDAATDGHRRTPTGKFQSRGRIGDRVGDRVAGTTGNGKRASRGPARVVKVSLTPKPITEAKASAKKSKTVKQQAMELGEMSAPEIDFDRRRLDPPKEGLPERFPEGIDELKDLALIFCRTFTYAKDPAKLKNHLGPYTDVLAGMRKQRVSVMTAWMAFREAVIAQEGRALFGHTSKRAYAYLPNGAAHRNRPPMPRLNHGEHAEWDEEAGRWMVGNDDDPPTAQALLAEKRRQEAARGQ